MLLIKERIEAIFLAGSRCYREVTEEFNHKYPEREPITVSAVWKIVVKFRETGSVQDKPWSGRPRTATNEDTATLILMSTLKSPMKSTRCLLNECRVSQGSVVCIFQMHKWHPYKIHMVQNLSEDDSDRCVEFYEWALDQVNSNPDFSSSILFSDEANFYVNGKVNKQNWQYWNDTYPHWLSPTKMQGASKLIVWCDVWAHRIVSPFFIDDNLNAERYLHMLQDLVFPSPMNEDEQFPRYFQQDGGPPPWVAYSAISTMLNRPPGPNWMAT